MGRHDDVLASIHYGAVPLTATNLEISAPAQSPRTNRVGGLAQELGPAIGPPVESQLGRSPFLVSTRSNSSTRQESMRLQQRRVRDWQRG